MAKPIVSLLAIWGISLGLIAILQALGAGIGFRIGPLGEDFNWVYFLQNHEQVPAQRAFWEYDARNPLAPWWYLAIKPLVLDTAYGLYAVRKVVDLICGLSVYAVVAALGGAAYRRQAVAAGGLTMLWTCSQLVGQINWTMIMAMSLGLLSVAASVRYWNGERREAAWYAASLVLYLAAIATYSLQISVVLGIAGLGVRRNGWRKGVADTIPFAALLLIFFLIWVTAGDVPAGGGGEFAAGRILRSLGFLVWDPAYGLIVGELLKYQGLDWALAAGAAMAGAFLYHRICGLESSQPAARSLAVDLGIVAAGVAAATVMLESTSGVWAPGARSPMVQQGVVPLLVTMAVLALGARRGRWVMFAVWALAAFLSLSHNARQVRWTEDLVRITAGLRAAVPAIEASTMFVFLDPPFSLSGYNSDIFVKNLYRSKNVNLRIFTPEDQDAPFSHLVFDSEAQGMYAESTLGQSQFLLRGHRAWIPYRQLVLMRYDETGVRQVNVLRKEDTEGFHVKFNRETALYLGERKAGPALALEQWELLNGRRAEAGAIILRGQPVSIAQHPVLLAAEAEYAVEFEARSEGDISTFYADFYGEGYDAAAQDHRITEPLGPEYRWVRFVIPTGPSPPARAWLRLINPSPGAVWIRSARISRLDTMEVGLLRP